MEKRKKKNEKEEKEKNFLLLIDSLKQILSYYCTWRFANGSGHFLVSVPKRHSNWGPGNLNNFQCFKIHLKYFALLSRPKQYFCIKKCA